MKAQRAGFLAATSVILCALAVSPTAADPQPVGQRVDYTDYKVVRVDVRTKAELLALHSIAADFLSDYPGPFPQNVVVPPDRMDDLRQSGLRFTILNDDLQEYIDRERLPAGKGRDTWDAYMDFNQIVTFINDLETARPDLCAVSSIGTSIEGRDIWMLHITGTTGGDKPAVLYHSLIHCREWITAPVVLYLADHLVNNYDTDPAVQNLVDSLDIYLVPVVNPDGYVYTWGPDRLWRKNRRDNGDGYFGVDLNRNWGYQWGYDDFGSDPYTWGTLYRGTGPFSEPETQTLRDFINAHPNLVAYMDYHSYSQLILWPWGYEYLGGPDEPDATTYQNLGAALSTLIQSVHGEYYEPGPVAETIYVVNGGSVDWVYGGAGVTALSIELRDTGFHGFELPADQILPTCQENLPAILHLTEWAAEQRGVHFRFPNGLPDVLAPAVSELVDVEVTALADSVVPGSPTLHYRYDGGTYQTAPLAHVSGDLYQATLPPALCSDTPEYYFSAEASTAGVKYEPAAAPAEMFTAQVGEFTTTFAENLDADPAWATEGQWAYGQPTGGGGGEHGGPDPSSGYTGLNVYGYNLDGDYPNNLAEQNLTSAAIDCTGLSGVHLRFWRWLGVERALYDHAYVRVSTNGTDWTTVWENASAVVDEAWTEMDLDISAVADDQPAVYLRWTMGSTDGGWTYCGWNIDDVRLVAFGCQDVDTDGDNVPDLTDNCPDDPNPPQDDADGDEVGDACDACPYEPALVVPEGAQESNCTDQIDNDCDGLTDTADPDCAGPGCPHTCGDIDGSGGLVDLNDFATFANCYGLSGPAGDCDATSLTCSDMDGNGTVNLSDFSTFALIYGLTSTNSPPNCEP